MNRRSCAPRRSRPLCGDPGGAAGAGIALQMAIDAPGRVRKLALLESENSPRFLVGINPLNNTFRSGHSHASAVRPGQAQSSRARVMHSTSAREFVAAPAASLSLIPDDIDDDQAAAYLAGAGLRRLVSNNLAQFAGLHWCRPWMRVNWRSTRTRSSN